MVIERTSLAAKLLVCVGFVAYLLICERAMTENPQLDFYIYRLGTQLAMEGTSPYDMGKIQARAAEEFPDDKTSFITNCGYFLSPEAIVVLVPFAKMQWGTAQLIWFLTLSCMGLVCGVLAYSFGRNKERLGIGWPIVVLMVWMNPITMPSLVIGQTSLFMVGCLALGQYAFENDCPRFGTFLWSLTFIKPHLALPFLVLAWALGGWKRATGIVVLVAGWNILGGLIVRGTFEGSFHLMLEYLEFLRSGHKVVIFNLVALNPQISSWNRILVAIGGPAIELKIWMTLTGYAVWALLIAGRLWFAGRLSRDRLDPAYLVAVTTVGTLFFAQVLGYELIFLVLLTPLILQHFDANRRRDAYTLIAILVSLMVPINLIGRLAERIGLEETSRLRTIMESHGCFGMAMLAAYLLIRGPARKPSKAASASTQSVQPVE